MASYKITRRRGGGGGGGSRRRPLKRSLKRRKVKTRKNIMKGGYKGTLVYDDGKRYEGQVTGRPNGKPNGAGTMTWPDGNTYTGNWNNGVMSGQGKMIWSNGNIYEGMWNKNNMDGKGKMIWHNGDSYDGDWKNSKRHGLGTLTLENKHEATGKWYTDEPKTKGDQERMGMALKKLSDEDPTFKVSTDDETMETIIAGMGELHLDIIKQRLFREFGVDSTVGKPQVAYRETILKKAEAEVKYAKQTGGRGQFGHVLLKVEPLEPGSGFEFVDEIKGGIIPKEFIPAVEDGVEGALEGGILAGFPVIDIRVTLYYGSFHEVDSSEIAFKIAGSMCGKEACHKAKIQLLEPVMSVEVVCPDDFVSNIVGDLNRRRARILGMEPRAGAQTVKCEVPLAEMFGYSTDLRSNSQGRATFTMEYHHYAAVPSHVAESVAKK